MQTKQQKAVGAYTRFCENQKQKSFYALLLRAHGKAIAANQPYTKESQIIRSIELITIEQNKLYVQWLEFKKTPKDFDSLIKNIKDHWFD